MRLSNVAHLRLPFGRLLGYDVTARGTKRALPLSFDQRRHVAQGQRHAQGVRGGRGGFRVTNRSRPGSP